MNYVVESIENGIAVIRYPNGSWAEVTLSADMTEEDLDNIAWMYKPKSGVSPSFLSEGSIRTASPAPGPIIDEEPQLPEWLQNRQDAYGLVSSQIEYITEHGLEAWQKHVAEIKSQNPKPSS